jgi:pimeloyl-ACP methyl ester carboxylesterase
MMPFLQRPRTTPEDHAAFVGLNVRHILLDDARTRAAVHVRGTFAPGRMPLVCIPGYNRNMSDFASFLSYFGRLRPNDRAHISDYGSLADAGDLADILTALGIGRAILLGQGHGGQVAMAFAAAHPLMVGGTILLDSGPVTDSRGIVRLRNNLSHLMSLRGKAVQAGFRRMLAGDHPGLTNEALDALALKTHYFDTRGRPRPLFDLRLIELLKDFSFNDVLVAQWPFYDALKCAPLMLLRTQLTDQLRRETFEEMVRRRPDAAAFTIAGQGSPALFDQSEEIEAVAKFVFGIGTGLSKAA